MPSLRKRKIVKYVDVSDSESGGELPQAHVAAKLHDADAAEEDSEFHRSTPSMSQVRLDVSGLSVRHFHLHIVLIGSRLVILCWPNRGMKGK